MTIWVSDIFIVLITLNKNQLHALPYFRKKKFLGLNCFFINYYNKPQYHLNNGYNIWAKHNMPSTIVQTLIGPQHKSTGSKLVRIKSMYDITYK